MASEFVETNKGRKVHQDYLDFQGYHSAWGVK
jgi:hypothetical protein